MPVERTSGGTSLIDVLDRVLDKGIVIDAWVRVSLVGIDLITVEARVVVASIDTYLKYSEAVGSVAPVSRPALSAGDGRASERGPGRERELRAQLAAATRDGNARRRRRPSVKTHVTPMPSARTTSARAPAARPPAGRRRAIASSSLEALLVADDLVECAQRALGLAAAPGRRPSRSLCLAAYARRRTAARAGRRASAWRRCASSRSASTSRSAITR